MIHEIYPDTFTGSFIADKKPIAGDYVLLYRDNKAILKKSGESHHIFNVDELAPDYMMQEMKYIGRLRDRDYYVSLENHSYLNEDEYITVDMWEVRNRFEKPLKWMVSLGFQFYKWFSENRFCGKCGGLMQDKGNERAMECPHCQITVYPVISPAIIVAISKGDEILLAQSVNFKGKFYGLIAGFVEVGETLEEAVKREVMEETGIEVKNITYYKNQPWPFSCSLMVGFFAEYDGNKPILIDPNEIADAKWFPKNNLPEIPGNDSIAGEMIRLVTGK
jgi:NAD+ diphosphatase